MIPDIEELFKTYADWIAWLRNKRTELETQRAKLKGQTEPGAAPVPDAVSDPQAQAGVSASPGAVTVSTAPQTSQADANASSEAVPPQNSQDLPDWL